MMEKEEKRAHKRFLRTLEVKYSTVKGLISDWTMNISKGGMFISTRDPLPEGTNLILKLKVPNSNEEIVLEGEVVWRVKPEESRGTLIPGMGLRFKNIDEEAIKKIERIINEQEG
jgi:uncharacterized protein (TIGR02266 family)